MLNKLLAISSFADLLNFAVDFATPSKREELIEELTNGNYDLQDAYKLPDYWLQVAADYIRKNDNKWKSYILEHDKPVVIVRMLQLLAATNPGVRCGVERLLEKISL